MKKKFAILGGILGFGLIWKKMNDIQKEVEYAERYGMNVYQTRKELNNEYDFSNFVANHSKAILKNKILRKYVCLRYGYNEEHVIDVAKKNIEFE